MSPSAWVEHTPLQGKIVADARPREGEPGTVFFFKEDLRSEQSQKGLDSSTDTQFSSATFTQVAEVFDSSSGGRSAATSHAKTDCSQESWSTPDTITTGHVAGREDGVFSPAQVPKVVVLLLLVKKFYSSSGGHGAATSPKPCRHLHTLVGRSLDFTV